MQRRGPKGEMKSEEFHALLGQLVETGNVDIRTLSKQLIKRAGGETGLADKIWDNYTQSIGTGTQSTNFTQVMKIIALGIEADKQKSPIDEMPADQIHRLIKKIMGDVKIGGDTTTGEGNLRQRLGTVAENLSAEGGPEPPGPEDGYTDSFDLEALARSLCREDGDGS
jgi:hypothetical protein